ncbi:MAG: hypothetical protein A4E53_03047 [Pelotomaculum sp. PtaB.Bin104]|nr:MAG: hypothetical protein A4E53_03047 [Pelotomaculum sp. PtaB.Bin104]
MESANNSLCILDKRLAAVCGLFCPAVPYLLEPKKIRKGLKRLQKVSNFRWKNWNAMAAGRIREAFSIEITVK